VRDSVRRRNPWSTIQVAPVRGNLSAGALELNQKRQTDAANLQQDTTVVVRLGEGGPEIQCQLSYYTRNEDRAVFSREDWESAGWPKNDAGLESIQLRKRTRNDIVRNTLSVRFVAIIAPILVAIFAIGPGLIWPPPSSDIPANQIASANQLARELATTPHLSPPALDEVEALQTELRAAQTSDTSVQLQQHRYDAAYLLYAVMVVALAIAVAVPQAKGFRRIKRQKKSPIRRLGWPRFSRSPK
jgi:hypothetical protein